MDDNTKVGKDAKRYKRSGVKNAQRMGGKIGGTRGEAPFVGNVKNAGVNDIYDWRVQRRALWAGEETAAGGDGEGGRERG